MLLVCVCVCVVFHASTLMRLMLWNISISAVWKFLQTALPSSTTRPTSFCRASLTNTTRYGPARLALSLPSHLQPPLHRVFVGSCPERSDKPHNNNNNNKRQGRPAGRRWSPAEMWFSVVRLSRDWQEELAVGVRMKVWERKWQGAPRSALRPCSWCPTVRVGVCVLRSRLLS